MTTTVTTAREAAELITATYDSADQFAAVAMNGCGEWELDRAEEIADASETLTTKEITDEIESLCKAKATPKISLAMDGYHVGWGRLVNGCVDNCDVNWSTDNSLSLAIYDKIDSAIASQKTSLTTVIDGEERTIAWSLS